MRGVCFGGAKAAFKAAPKIAETLGAGRGLLCRLGTSSACLAACEGLVFEKKHGRALRSVGARFPLGASIERFCSAFRAAWGRL
jgi:hypothetical protein